MASEWRMDTFHLPLVDRVVIRLPKARRSTCRTAAWGRMRSGSRWGNDDVELAQILSAQRSSLRGDAAIEKINGDGVLVPITRVVRVHEDASVEKQDARAVAHT